VQVRERAPSAPVSDEGPAVWPRHEDAPVLAQAFAPSTQSSEVPVCVLGTASC